MCYCSGLLIAAAGKCLFAEAFTLFSMSFPRTPLSLGVAEEADFIGIKMLLECFLSVDHCSAAMFSMTIQKRKRLNPYICFFSADFFLKQSLADLLQMRCGQAVT